MNLWDEKRYDNFETDGQTVNALEPSVTNSEP